MNVTSSGTADSASQGEKGGRGIDKQHGLVFNTSMNTDNTPNTGSVLDALPLPQVEFYYDAVRNKYWVVENNETWIQFNKEDALNLLEEKGYQTKAAKGKSYSDAEYYLHKRRMNDNVSYAGPIAGNKVGFKTVNGHRLLITSGPNLIEPKKGDFHNIDKLGERLFGSTQFMYVKGWLKTALFSLYKNETKHSQMLVMAGPPGCGKSFWQNQILTPLLGGRVARPMQFMTGHTTFNDDLIKAEHFLLEDENSRIDIGARREFGTAIKNFTVNRMQRVHAKGRDAFMVESKHWLSLSVNDEPENLSILPPIDASLEDKLIILKCHRAINSEWPTVPLYDFEYLIRDELPAFIHYLLEEFMIPDEMVSLRFGVNSFLHKDIVSQIDGLSPESDLEDLIDTVFKQLKQEKGKLKITGLELQIALESDHDVGHRARKLLYFSTACSVYLERLSRRKKHKFIKPHPSDRPRSWTIDWSCGTLDAVE